MKKLVVLVGVTLLGICVPQAQAALNMSYKLDGAGPTSLVVVGTNPIIYPDISGPLGGVIDLGVTVAQSDSPGGTTSNHLVSTNVQVVNLDATASHTLELFITAQDYTSPITPPALLLTSSIGGSIHTPLVAGDAANLMSFTSCVDATNGATACSISALTAGPGTPNVTGNPTPSYNDTQTALITSLVPSGGGGTYSVGQDIFITLGANTQLNFSTTTSLSSVPEPASIALLGGVMLVCVTLIRRKIKHQA